MNDRKTFLIFLTIFLLFYFVPFDSVRFQNAIMEAFYLTQWYAREHVILCLIPAFFIAGAISIFVSQDSVLRYLGAKANRILSYGVASVSGTILSVCSCTVLPLFAGIYKRGAGLGPATAFLYSGPAINVLAIILTARVLGIEIGLARAIGAIIFSIVIGALMAFLFRKEDSERLQEIDENPASSYHKRGLIRDAVYFGIMVALLVFLNWGRDDIPGLFSLIYSYKWYISLILVVLLAVVIVKWFEEDEIKSWTISSWEYAKMIFPLLFIGVFVAGFLLGRPEHEGVIPSRWVALLVGGNSLLSNFIASIVGAFMYFATLTEVPIVQALIGSGMGKGPALALLLSGPPLSLPSMLVIHSILGFKKTLVYVLLVIIFSTFTGFFFGMLM